MYVYCLQSTDGSTYIGATVNLVRRLRQHNKELVGGAQITSRKVLAGQTWTCYCYVEGFPNWQACLQFEWRWKQLSRKLSLSPIEKRKAALVTLLSLDRSTTKAIPYSEWPTLPFVVYPEKLNVHEPLSSDLKNDESINDSCLLQSIGTCDK
jgi:structure-specific endonuclease subunit SLX1